MELANDFRNWVMFSDLEKEAIRNVMGLVGIDEPCELARVAILEYVQTIRDNPHRWTQM